MSWDKPFNTDNDSGAAIPAPGFAVAAWNEIAADKAGVKPEMVASSPAEICNAIMNLNWEMANDKSQPIEARIAASSNTLAALQYQVALYFKFQC